MVVHSHLLYHLTLFQLPSFNPFPFLYLHYEIIYRTWTASHELRDLVTALGLWLKRTQSPIYMLVVQRQCCGQVVDDTRALYLVRGGQWG